MQQNAAISLPKALPYTWRVQFPKTLLFYQPHSTLPRYGTNDSNHSENIPNDHPPNAATCQGRLSVFSVANPLRRNLFPGLDGIYSVTLEFLTRSLCPAPISDRAKVAWNFRLQHTGELVLVGAVLCPYSSDIWYLHITDGVKLNLLLRRPIRAFDTVRKYTAAKKCRNLKRAFEWKRSRSNYSCLRQSVIQKNV